MKEKITLMAAMLWLSTIMYAQEVKFSEYDMPNGLHVILHQDKTVPVVAVSVMYHVGSKDEDPGRTGFAHFFEHLLFEGTDNIKRGEFMKLVSSNGGQNNANTSQDRTFYYEVFPSNQLELGLWLESERMSHPKVEEIGVKTQNEVVKEEKRSRVDNNPYGKFSERIFASLFEGHPYRWETIGSMQHLDEAKLEEFTRFFKKFYVPNNAVLTIAGDIDLEQTKFLVDKYFAYIPKGEPIIKPVYELQPLTRQKVDTVYDANIQLPAIFVAYRLPKMASRDIKVAGMINCLLTEGGSSRLVKQMVDIKESAVQVSSFNQVMEDHSVFITLALPNNQIHLKELLTDIDTEIARIQTELISNEELQKLRCQFENKLINTNDKLIGLAENLSNGYLLKNKHTNAVNELITDIQSITREEIRDVARKYLKNNSRVVLYYLPAR